MELCRCAPGLSHGACVLNVILRAKARETKGRGNLSMEGVHTKYIFYAMSGQIKLAKKFEWHAFDNVTRRRAGVPWVLRPMQRYIAPYRHGLIILACLEVRVQSSMNYKRVMSCQQGPSLTSTFTHPSTKK
jgi:hypothetical protein